MTTIMLKFKIRARHLLQIRQNETYFSGNGNYIASNGGQGIFRLYSTTTNTSTGTASADANGPPPGLKFNTVSVTIPSAQSQEVTNKVDIFNKNNSYTRVNDTNYFWDVVVRNNDLSSNITSLILASNVYSSTAPAVTNLPSGWTFTNILLSPASYSLTGDNRWLTKVDNISITPGNANTLVYHSATPAAYEAAITGGVPAYATVGGEEEAERWLGPVQRPIPEPLTAMLYVLLAAGRCLARSLKLSGTFARRA